MAIEVRCKCGKMFRVKDELAGKRGRCSNCGMGLLIPIPSPVLRDAVSSTSAAQRCPKCQASLPANSEICVTCSFDVRTGTRLAPVEFNPAVVLVKPRPKSRPASSLARAPLLFIGVGCVLVLVAVASVFYVVGRSQRDAEPNTHDLPTGVAEGPASHPIPVTPPRPQATIDPETAAAGAGNLQFIDAKFVDSITVEQTVGPGPKTSEIARAGEGRRLLWTRFRFRPLETATTLSFAWVSAKADETNWRIGPVCLDATLQFAERAPAHASFMGDRTGLAVSNSPPLYGQPISLETSAIKVEVAPNGLSVQRGSGDVFLSFFFVVPQNAKGFTIGELEGRSFNVAMDHVPPSEVVVSVPTADSPKAEAAASIPPSGSENPAGKDPLAIARSLPREPRPDRIIRQARALPGTALDQWEGGFRNVVAGYSMSRTNMFLFLSDFTRLYDKETFLDADSAKFIQRLTLVPRDHVVTWEAALRKSISQRLVPPLPDDIGALVVIVQQDSLFPAGSFDPASSQQLAERIATIPASAIEEMSAAAGQNSATEATDAALAIAHYDPLFVENVFQQHVWRGLSGRLSE